MSLMMTMNPIKAGRLIQSFVVDELSNWYVRLCENVFGKELTEDKKQLIIHYTLSKRSKYTHVSHFTL